MEQHVPTTPKTRKERKRRRSASSLFVANAVARLCKDEGENNALKEGFLGCRRANERFEALSLSCCRRSRCWKMLF